MLVLIDIPEDVYNRCKEYQLFCGEAEILEAAVAKGTLMERWNGMHGQTIAPAGTFEKIYNEADEEDDIWLIFLKEYF